MLMKQSIVTFTSDEISDLANMRRWVREHYSPESEHLYESVEGKLNLLDEVIRQKWIAPSETIKLQSLGIALGDALAQELGLDWVMVEDEFGRDPAIHLHDSSVFVFPKTMISKRIEDGEDVDINELFNGVCLKLKELLREISN